MNILLAHNGTDAGLLRPAIESLPGTTGVVESADLETARRHLAERPIGVAVLDLDCDRHQHIDGLNELRRIAPQTPIVVVATRPDPQRLHRALAVGARGILARQSPPEEVHKAVQTVLDGGIYVPPTLLATPAGGESNPALDHPLLKKLTLRQRDVLREVLAGHSNRDVAERLGLTEGTVKIHMTAILKSLGVKSRAQAIVLLGNRAG